MKKIVDFGEKLGGARKDTWKDGLTIAHLNGLNEDEKLVYVHRDTVFPLPNAIKQVNEEGYSPFAAYTIRYFRRAIKKKPDSADIEGYVNAVNTFKEKVLAIKTDADVKTFAEVLKDMKKDFNYWSKYIYISNISTFLYYQNKYKTRCENSNFPKTSKKGKERKKSFIPPQLTCIVRDGENILKGRNVYDGMWQDTFAFKGVEFGNWTSQKVRQTSLNYAYEALYDLAESLMIDNKDIAFNKALGLGFGSRGNSCASAHYEPLREVINLTKMHGAGCLAHEWAHALDDKIGKFYSKNPEPNTLASNYNDMSGLPSEFTELIYALKYDANGTPTDFFRGSRRFDKDFRKDAHGHWASNCEMFARAFACYVKDTANFRSDYLFAQADTYVFEFDDMYAAAIPQGEERLIINEMFDCLIYRLKKDGFFSKRTKTTKPEQKKEEKAKKVSFEYELEANEYGQMLLYLL